MIDGNYTADETNVTSEAEPTAEYSTNVTAEAEPTAEYRPTTNVTSEVEPTAEYPTNVTAEVVPTAEYPTNVTSSEVMPSEEYATTVESMAENTTMYNELGRKAMSHLPLNYLTLSNFHANPQIEGY